MIGRFFAWLWNLARYAPSVAPGIRFGGGASVLLTFLFFVFFIIGLILVGLGFDLGEIETWLDDHGSWFELIGDIILKGAALIALLICALVVFAPLFDRDSRSRSGGCLALGALVIGYLCFVLIFQL